MAYRPGLHLLSTFTSSSDQLVEASACQALFDQLIDSLQLTKVGEVYHAFPNGGFTAVVCLTESHVSIHTWPELGIATFDVFLSNYLHDNTAKARQFYEEVLRHFSATELSKQELTR
ncbi:MULTISPECIES: S-adenosylmethionine decarboxylase family protein [unclassified Spirosoma]|uniref:S-adenosylmethionine decarboxylase family protein n=1 Tax=unclassified Spirosoma TaxID=2621999 RepID=UPI000964C7DD|nr:MULTISPECIES: S-adenosylmethionine decarboxylase [unclassified Spirosoma]MBN8826218.1 S-adenosylmethionine decarboxylase [Spirosoma sp.]OJW76887.1 MAG: S-adenosylmethionine decarboxylase [Spirosoma sp. 48-14]